MGKKHVTRMDAGILVKTRGTIKLPDDDLQDVPTEDGAN